MRPSERELKILGEALRWLRYYDNCNPDVGMPPGDEILLDQLLLNLHMQLIPEEREIVINYSK